MLRTIMALETSFLFSGTMLHEDDIFNDDIVDQYVVAIDANGLIRICDNVLNSLKKVFLIAESNLIPSRTRMYFVMLQDKQEKHLFLTI